jgi:ferredoxin, 2Fe-2S
VASRRKAFTDRNESDVNPQGRRLATSGMPRETVWFPKTGVRSVGQSQVRPGPSLVFYSGEKYHESTCYIRFGMSKPGMWGAEGVPKVSILPDNLSAEIRSGTSLLKCAELMGIDLLHSCGGVAACTTCRVVVKAGKENLSALELAESEVLSESGILHSHRLACQARILGDVVLERPV